MRQNSFNAGAAGAMALYFAKATLPTQQQTLGEIVVEILKDGKSLSRKSICIKLLSRLDKATNTEQESHYNTLIGLLFD